MNDVRSMNGGISRPVRSWCIRMAGATLAAALLMWSGRAEAEITLKTAKGWTLSADGRMNTFGSFMTGDRQPDGIPNWNGGVDEWYGTTDTQIRSTRIRSGFISNILGFNLVKPLTETLKVTARFSLWVGIAEARSKTDRTSIDARELYVKLEGGWGNLLLGKNLALFGRGGILMDYDVQHAFGMGFPCGTITAPVASCGYAGHGLLFPSFNAGIVYTTPSMGGLELAAGLYDPASVNERNYNRTPYPRVEAEATFRFRQIFRVWAGALWQRIGTNQNATNQLMADARGFTGGFMLSVGPWALGASAYQGKGLGVFVPMENHPLFADQQGVLRGTQGAVGITSISFGGAKLAVGGGVTLVSKTSTEQAELNANPQNNGAFATQPPAKRQIGASIGYYHTFLESLTFALEYFRGQYEWYDLLDPNTMMGVKKHQNVNFVNTGLTLVW